MAYEGFAITKIVHVFFAVAWIGGAFYQQVVVGPVLEQADEAGRRQVAGRLTPLMLKYHNIVGGFTLLTGVGLVFMNPYGVGWGDLLETYWGRLVAFALVGTVAMLYLVNVAIRPTARVLGEKMAEHDPGDPVPPGLQLLQKRLVLTSRLALVVGLIVLVSMVAANVSGLVQA